MTKEQLTYLRNTHGDNMVIYGDNMILAQSGYDSKVNDIIFDDNREIYHSIKINCSTDHKFASKYPINVTSGTYDLIQYVGSSKDFDTFEKFLDEQVKSGNITDEFKNNMISDFKSALE